MKRKNVRPLGTIADNIHQLVRGNIIDIGDLLLEAKAQCERGQWLYWLSAEFTWSVDSAERYMRVAQLAGQFRSLRNLKLGATTLYDLADHDGEENLPIIVEELAKHATKTPLGPRGDTWHPTAVSRHRSIHGAIHRPHRDGRAMSLTGQMGPSGRTTYGFRIEALPASRLSASLARRCRAMARGVLRRGGRPEGSRRRTAWCGRMRTNVLTFPTRT
jgi:hypothetical protein